MLAQIYLTFVIAFLVFKGQNVLTCEEDEFPCENGQCIPADVWCDSEKDCTDGSDEALCLLATAEKKDPNNCSSKYFKCDNGQCIPLIGRCNNFGECDNGSDEFGCEFSLHVKNESLKNVRFEYQLLSPSAIPLQLNFSNPKNLGYQHDSNFKKLDPEAHLSNIQSARRWLFSQMRKDFGWGDETPRAIIALQLSETSEREEEDKTEELMSKQLDIQLSIALSRGKTKAMSMPDLALYINALQALCRNPRNFYGYNLVKELREKVDSAHTHRPPLSVTPFVYLTLCLNNQSVHHDLNKLRNMVSSATVYRTDFLVLASLATFCIERLQIPTKDSVYENFYLKLHQKIEQGLPGNVYELALLVQALNVLRIDENVWNEAVKRLLNSQLEDGSFGDILATYYALPVLSGRSLFLLPDYCVELDSSGLTPIEVLRNSKERSIAVIYNIKYGSPAVKTHTLQIRVPENTRMLDLMRLAKKDNPEYRFRLDGSGSVYSIGGVPNDAERCMYWILIIRNYNSRHQHSVGNYTGSINHLKLSENCEVVFWRKYIAT